MDVDDWLLPQPEDTVPSSGLRTPEGALDEQAFTALVDYAAHELIEHLPAFCENGEPTIPPERHVRDHLARTNSLVSENDTIDHPFPATTVAVYWSDVLPDCDICRASEAGRYEAHVSTPSGAGGAVLCTSCARPLVERLGGGDGAVYIMRPSEVPDELQVAVNERLRELGRGPLFSPETP